MQKDIFRKPAYQNIVSSHLRETIEFLLENNKEFAVACSTEFIEFDPALPKDIYDHFGETLLFVLAGYTFSSVQIEKDELSFEAGFGDENFGSLVTLPLLAIKQIFVDDYPVAINVSRPTKILNTSSSSPEPFLSNPENKKLLKKRKPR